MDELSHSISRTALITGIAGQDGAYLAELLLEFNYSVIGIVAPSTNLSADWHLHGRVIVESCDLLSGRGLVEILRLHQPNEIYNLAAYSSGERMNEAPVEVGLLNGFAVQRVLDAVRHVLPSARFCQASSSEMFGLASTSPQDENTPLSPRSIYGAAKCYAHSITKLYRELYGLFCCSAILYNHESPRRRLEFVSRKITHNAAKVKLGLADALTLGNLNARRDWSFAGDIIRGMWLMLQAPTPRDYILSSGVTHSVRDLCDIAFSYLGLDSELYVREDASISRPSESVWLVGDPSRAERELGWKRNIDVVSMIRMMVDADMETLRSAKGVVIKD